MNKLPEKTISMVDATDLFNLSLTLNERIDDLVTSTCDSLQYGSSLNIMVNEVIDLREAHEALHTAMQRILKIEL